MVNCKVTKLKRLYERNTANKIKMRTIIVTNTKEIIVGENTTSQDQLINPNNFKIINTI